MNFSTYGPYVLKEWSADGLADFLSTANEDKARLDKGIGVYIVALRNKKGELTPYYVGKTINGFRTRFSQHLKADRFASLFEIKGSNVEVFLLPRVTNKGRLRRVTPKLKEMGKLNSIDRLEFALIGSSLTKNPNLLNLQMKAFHKWFHVPGYWNSQPENFDDAAFQLASMVGSK